MSKIYIYIVAVFIAVLAMSFFVEPYGYKASAQSTDCSKITDAGAKADCLRVQGGGGGSSGGASDGCAGVDTSIIKCKTGTGDGIEGTGIWSLLLMAINILTAGVGVAALGGVVYGAVLYSSAGGNPEQVKKAKGMFMNVAIGVISFAAMYFLLNFLIPGGVIG